MTANIEKMRAGMVNDQKRLAWENGKFAVSLIVAAAALGGAGVALGNYIGSRRPAPRPSKCYNSRPEPRSQYRPRRRALRNRSF